LNNEFQCCLQLPTFGSGSRSSQSFNSCGNKRAVIIPQKNERNEQTKQTNKQKKTLRKQRTEGNTNGQTDGRTRGTARDSSTGQSQPTKKTLQGDRFSTKGRGEERALKYLISLIFLTSLLPLTN